jgi:hypothetical protein
MEHKMTDTEDFDLTTFQHQVYEALGSIIDYERGSGEKFRRKPTKGIDQRGKIRIQFERSKKAARELITHERIRDILCPSLQLVSKDVFEIAKIITPLLVGAAIAKTIVIPLQPTIFAAIAILIARIGVTNLCPEIDSQQKKKITKKVKKKT